MKKQQLPIEMKTYVTVVWSKKDTLCDVYRVAQSNDRPSFVADKYIKNVLLIRRILVQ